MSRAGRDSGFGLKENDTGPLKGCVPDGSSDLRVSSGRIALSALPVRCLISASEPQLPTPPTQNHYCICVSTTTSTYSFGSAALWATMIGAMNASVSFRQPRADVGSWTSPTVLYLAMRASSSAWSFGCIASMFSPHSAFTASKPAVHSALYCSRCSTCTGSPDMRKILSFFAFAANLSPHKL